MKRNMDLVRELLFAVEGLSPDGSSIDQTFKPQTVSVDSGTLREHVRLLLEKELVSGDASDSMEDKFLEFRMERLTWSGHEFLDAVRNDSIWSRVKQLGKEQGLSLTLGVTKSLAIQLTKEKLKQIGIPIDP